MLSTTYVAPCAVGELGERGVVGHERSSGWRWSRRRGRASGAAASAAADRVEVGHVDEVDPTPKPPNVAVSWVRVEPYDATGATIRSPARTQRGERGVDRAHPRGEGDARRAAGELRVGRAERARGRVRDAAVGVAGAGVGGDPAELLGVGRGERRGLVDRARSSASGRRAGSATRPGWRGSRSPWRWTVAAGRCRSRERCYTGVGGAARLTVDRHRPSRGSCRRASRRTSRRRR